MPTELQPVAPGDLITADLVNRLIDRIRALEQELAPFLVNPVIESVVPGETGVRAITPGRFINIRGRNFAAEASENRLEFVALPPEGEPRTFPPPANEDGEVEGQVEVEIDLASTTRNLIRVRLPQEVQEALGPDGRLVRIRVTVGGRPPAEFDVRTGLTITIPPRPPRPDLPNRPDFPFDPPIVFDPRVPIDPRIPFDPRVPFDPRLVARRRITDEPTIADIRETFLVSATGGALR